MKVKKGFTLIELLIVVAIIAILAAIAIPNFLEAQTRAKVTKVKTDFRLLREACEAYALDNDTYPTDNPRGTGPLGDYWVQCVLTTPIAYITSVPTNPFYEQTDTHTAGNIGGLGSYKFWGSDRHPNILPIHYHIISNGPNLRRDNLGGLDGPLILGRDPRYLNELYDPTNGTVSYGDMGVCDYGIFPLTQ